MGAALSVIEGVGMYERKRFGRVGNNEPVELSPPAVEASGDWYVVWTRVLQERKAASELQWRGFETYLPLRPAEGRERLRAKDFPAYPRYCFVRLDTAQPGWTKVFSTPGVSDVVRGAEGEIYALPDGTIDRLRGREIEGMHYARTPRGKFKCGYLKGEPVRVIEGTLSGFCGFFEKALDPQTAQVTLLMFGRVTLVTLALAAIKASQ